MRATKTDEDETLNLHELHLAAFHEAGHLIVLRTLGGYADARIWANTNRSIDEVAWCGQCRMWCEPTCPENWKVLVGMAGFVSECIYAGIYCSTEIAGLLQDAVELGDLSVSDERMIGPDFSFDEVSQTANLLNAAWADVTREATYLINSAPHEVLSLPMFV